LDADGRHILTNIGNYKKKKKNIPWYYPPIREDIVLGGQRHVVLLEYYS